MILIYDFKSLFPQQFSIIPFQFSVSFFGTFPVLPNREYYSTSGNNKYKLTVYEFVKINIFKNY